MTRYEQRLLQSGISVLHKERAEKMRHLVRGRKKVWLKYV